MINDLPDGLQLFYHLFANGTKLGGKRVSVKLIQGGLDKTIARALRNTMLLNKVNSQHLYFGSTLPLTLLFPNSTGDVHCAKDLGVRVDYSLSPSSQIDAVITMARGMLIFIKRAFRRLSLPIPSLALHNGTFFH